MTPIHQYLLLEALKRAPQGQEARLFRLGPLPGLFARRTRDYALAAEHALHERLFEITRVEAQGKRSVEFVRITPKGLQYVVQHESPARLLSDLYHLLQVSEEGLPAWLAALQKNFDDHQQRVLLEVVAIREQLGRLSERVRDAMERVEAQLPAPAGLPPWVQPLVAHLAARRLTPLGDVCPLAELFGVVRLAAPSLAIQEFHSGLRQLRDQRVIELLSGDAAPAPEFALLDGSALYHAARLL